MESTKQSSLLNALDRIRPHAYVTQSVESIADSFESDAESAQQIAKAIQALHSTRQRYPNMDDAAFVDEAVSAVLSQKSVQGDEDLLRSFLTKLLSIRAVAVSVKAARVLLDTERHVHDATICTDMRPVFDTPGSSIDGYLLMHTLRIAFAEDGKDQDIYFFLDNMDLDTLEEAIQRARRKASVLRATADTAGMKIIEELSREPG